MQDLQLHHYLSLSIDTNDSRSGLVWGSDKYCVTTDSVHVDASSSFNVIQVDISILCYKKSNSMFLTHLKDNKKLLTILIFAISNTDYVLYHCLESQPA